MSFLSNVSVSDNSVYICFFPMEIYFPGHRRKKQILHSKHYTGQRFFKIYVFIAHSELFFSDHIA